MAPVVAPRAPAVAATATTAQTAPPATPQATHQHGGHHGPHRSGGQGRQVGGNRPGARPKRSTTSKARKSRRRGANGIQGDDDDHDFHSAESQQTGTQAVGLKDQSQDSGDDQDEGGGERSRQDKLAQARSLSQKSDEPGRGGSPRRVFDSKIPLQRCKKGMLGVVQKAVIDRELNKAAETGNGALAASALRKLNLALLGSARAGARLDSGGLNAVAEYLAANYLKPALPEGGFPLSIKMLHWMLPMKLLQLQVPRTEEQSALSIAKMLVQARRNQP
ncbi:hypothetical protein ASE08_26415 [Rhizobacter sp. Root16D2]|nr:hypothetical protein ASC88_13120 [Rhizobacter sp. Root29]KQW03481.1 hypothetical protein ASC98_27310 [Rhizobacter sp. Root1238]KRB15905.1 hypothetical protein ASE08_26415 [Rhizobacter sp. Root16D2]